MLKFYTYKTINGEAVELALIEMGIDHQKVNVDLFAGEQRSAEFLKINPSGRIPCIEHEVNGDTTTVSQTGAILIYLAEFSGKFLPKDTAKKAKVLEYLFFQLTDISINVFNNFYLKSLIKPPHAEAAEVLKDRALSFYQVFNERLQHHKYIAGNDISIADFATFPVVHRLIDSEDIQKLEKLVQWHQTLCQRASIVSIYQLTTKS